MVTLLNTYPCVTKVMDMRTQQISFISSNAIDNFGYSKNQSLEGGLAFYNEIAHPEDLHKTWKLLKAIWDFMLAVPSKNQGLYKFNYDYRIITPDRRELRILAQNSVLHTARAVLRMYWECIPISLIGRKTDSKQPLSFRPQTAPASSLILKTAAYTSSQLA